jgi:hypothetical protein
MVGAAELSGSVTPTGDREQIRGRIQTMDNATNSAGPNTPGRQLSGEP